MALDAARETTEKEGLKGLKARGIARAIGYTIGTLYNLFDDLDDLIVHMNTETLDALYEVCDRPPLSGRPEADLAALASRYVGFTQAHPLLWNAVFEHRLPDGRDLPGWYQEKVVRLISLVEAALSPLFTARQIEPEAACGMGPLGEPPRHRFAG